jgi:hypothetical protein
MRTLNITALSAELRETAKRLKEMKKERRNPPGGYSAATLAEKAMATLLCALRAGHRGKVHLPGMVLEEQTKMLAKTNLSLRFALKIQPEGAAVA